MQTQKATIKNQLEKHGWKVVQIEEDTLDWWADEIWILESVWTPVDKHVYLTFLVDPQSGYVKNRRKGGYFGAIKSYTVWAVKASATKPHDWLSSEGEFVLDFGHNWLKELPSFIQDLSSLRNQET